MRLINNMRLIAKCPRVYDIMIIAQAYFPLSGFCLLTICKQFINWMVGSSGNKAKALQWRILGSGCVRLNQSVLPHYKWHWKEVRRSHRGSICQALQQCFWSFYPHKTPEQRNSQITLCWPYLQVAHSSPFKTRITMLAYSSLVFKAASTDQMWYWYSIDEFDCLQNYCTADVSMQSTLDRFNLAIKVSLLSISPLLDHLVAISPQHFNRQLQTPWWYICQDFPYQSAGFTTQSGWVCEFHPEQMACILCWDLGSRTMQS